MKINLLGAKMMITLMSYENWKRRKGNKDLKCPLIITDINYAGDKDDQHCFDLLKADPAKRKNRLLIDIHGGAYVYGTRRNNYPFGHYFYDQGYDVIMADYTLVNKVFDVSTQIHDIAEMINYIYSHLEELGLMQDDLYLAGDSSGGHLALIMAEAFSSVLVQMDLTIRLPNDRPKCVLVNCPVYDFEHIADSLSATKGATKFIFGPRYSEEGWMKTYSPKTYISSLEIPLFYSSCRNDFLLGDSKKLDKDLDGSPLKHSFFYNDSSNKKVGHVHNVIAPKDPESEKTNQAMLAFMDTYSKNKAI